MAGQLLLNAHFQLFFAEAEELAVCAFVLTRGWGPGAAASPRPGGGSAVCHSPHLFLLSSTCWGPCVSDPRLQRFPSWGVRSRPTGRRRKQEGQPLLRKLQTRPCRSTRSLTRPGHDPRQGPIPSVPGYSIWGNQDNNNTFLKGLLR